MKLEDLGEFGWIERVRARVGAPDAATRLGIGDDAAVIARIARGASGAPSAPASPVHDLLVTTDASLEGVHFRFDFSSPREIGAKAAAGALSDIAAMGGAPSHLFLAFGAPPTSSVETADAILDGILSVASAAGAHLAGGDTIASPDRVLLVLTVLGAPVGAAPIARSGARPGDALLVTGALGGSLAGLTLLLDAPDRVAEPAFAAALLRHRAPSSRIPEAALLATQFHPTSMIDISDGLSSDVRHLADASGVGFRIDLASLPIHPGARAVAAALGGDATHLALTSGEEYELLFTVPADEASAIARALPAATGTPANVIGEATAARGVVARDASGREAPLPTLGHRHF